MKLRNSFISVKLLSDELNIPLHSNDVKKIVIKPTDYEIKSKSEPSLDEVGKTKPNRVRNLKKSMLNDGKLMKLKQKFLKRSKSSIEVKLSDPIVRPTITETIENVQNKENECPRVLLNDNQPKSPYTLNRNKVKMGTRVFSSQFLNKSVDNIYDTPLDVYRVDVSPRKVPIRRDRDHDEYEDALSMKSTSVGSIYFTNKQMELYPEVIENGPHVIRKYRFI